MAVVERSDTTDGSAGCPRPSSPGAFCLSPVRFPRLPIPRLDLMKSPPFFSVMMSPFFSPFFSFHRFGCRQNGGVMADTIFPFNGF